MIAGLFFLLSLGLTDFVPDDYSHDYCVILLAVFILSAVWFLKRMHQKNYFTFHFFFFFSYFFVNFVYPVFLFPVDPDYFSVFRYVYDFRLLNKAAALALLGSSSYILGAVMVKKYWQAEPDRSEVNSAWIGHARRVFVCLSIFFFTLFLLFVGKSFFGGRFDQYGRVLLQFLNLFQLVLALAIVTAFFEQKDRFSGTMKDFFARFPRSLLFILISMIGLFLYFGDRGPVLQAVFTFFALFSLWVKPVHLRYLVVFLLAGMLVMTFVAYARSSDEALLSEGNSWDDYVGRGVENIKVDSVLDLGRDLIVNNVNLYIAMGYVEQNGLNYGRTMIANIASLIPGLGTVLQNIFHMDPDRFSSGRLLTRTVFTEGEGWGLGGNIVGDIFISFGTAGVAVLMFLFGYVNSRIQTEAGNGNNLYYITAYAISVSFSFYYPRASLLVALRPVLWSLLLLFAMKHFYRFFRVLRLKSGKAEARIL